MAAAAVPLEAILGRSAQCNGRSLFGRQFTRAAGRAPDHQQRMMINELGAAECQSASQPVARSSPICSGLAWPNFAQLSSARLGSARLGSARLGSARLSSLAGRQNTIKLPEGKRAWRGQPKRAQIALGMRASERHGEKEKEKETRKRVLGK